MSRIPSHPKDGWMPPMSREEPLHLYDRAAHVSWLASALGARRLIEDLDFRAMMAKFLAKWETMTSERERRYAEAWKRVLGAEGEDGARILMALDANGVTAREALPDGYAYFDQALRVSLRIKAEEQYEDGLVTYARDHDGRRA